MKIAPREAERFLREPDPDVRAVLIYGPDGGLVRERAEALHRTVVGDPTDPFRTAELTPADLKDGPARLTDEAAALSMTGGRRAVRLRAADDGLTPVLQEFLADTPGEALVIVEAGDLSARSPLRKIFEGAKTGAAVPCYRDDERSLSRIIDESLRTHGLTASPDARAYLAANLGGDRQLTRQELDKLALYKGPAGGTVELEDAQAIVGDSAERSLEDLAYAVADGNLGELERTLQRSFREGAQPIAVVRAVARHLQRLHLVAGQAAGGAPSDQAIGQLRPPVFWKLKERFKDQAAGWPPRALARALQRLLDAEMASKQTGAPAQVVCARALLETAANAPTRARRRAG